VRSKEDFENKKGAQLDNHAPAESNFVDNRTKLLRTKNNKARLESSEIILVVNLVVNTERHKIKLVGLSLLTIFSDGHYDFSGKMYPASPQFLFLARVFNHPFEVVGDKTFKTIIFVT